MSNDARLWIRDDKEKPICYWDMGNCKYWGYELPYEEPALRDEFLKMVLKDFHNEVIDDFAYVNIEKYIARYGNLLTIVKALPEDWSLEIALDSGDKYWDLGQEFELRDAIDIGANKIYNIVRAILYPKHRVKICDCYVNDTGDLVCGNIECNRYSMTRNLLTSWLRRLTQKVHRKITKSKDDKWYEI